MLILDTNVYLDASTDAAIANRVSVLIEDSGDQVGSSSVVIGELLVGVKPRDRARLIGWVTSGIDDSALLTPMHADWIAAGDALQRLGGGEAS